MKPDKTIKLIMPQWQGGNNPLYYLGAELLAWLAPETAIPTFKVPVATPKEPLRNEAGIMGRRQIVQQLDEAYKLLEEHKPAKVIMFGGDCLVDLAPFSYLSEHYREDFGILWIDAHPDVMTPEQFENSHAHVLGALMGNGDSDLTKNVRIPVHPEKIMIAGIHNPTTYEAQFLKEHALTTISPDALKTSDKPVIDWIEKQKIKALAIHIDLDVLDFHLFHSLLMAEPGVDPKKYAGIADGRLTMDNIVNLINKVNNTTNIVGIGIAEHLPWDALHLKNMLSKLPLINGN